MPPGRMRRIREIKAGIDLIDGNEKIRANTAPNMPSIFFINSIFKTSHLAIIYHGNLFSLVCKDTNVEKIV